MERVLGIGGYFMRAAGPAALGAWYRDCLGLDADENGLWRQGAGLTVFATFESEDRKSTRLNSSHVAISYAVLCLKKKTRESYPRNGTMLQHVSFQSGPQRST